MKRWSPIIILLATHAAFAGEVKVQYRLTGLFQPDRVEDLRRQADALPANAKEAPAEVKLVEVNYDTTVVTFSFDDASPNFRKKSPDQIHERINGWLRQASKGAFQVFPLSMLKPEQQKEERIAIAVLDCKGCAYGAYRAIATTDGVERAVVSLKEGWLTAWLDPAKTNREALVAALEKARVTVVKTEPAEPLKKAN